MNSTDPIQDACDESPTQANTTSGVVNNVSIVVTQPTPESEQEIGS